MTIRRAVLAPGWALALGLLLAACGSATQDAAPGTSASTPPPAPAPSTPSETPAAAPVTTRLTPAPRRTTSAPARPTPRAPMTTRPAAPSTTAPPAPAPAPALPTDLSGVLDPTEVLAEVPNVIGSTEASATEDMHKAGFKTTRKDVPANGQPVGTVLGQFPKDLEQPPGSTIELWVAAG